MTIARVCKGGCIGDSDSTTAGQEGGQEQTSIWLKTSNAFGDDLAQDVQPGGKGKGT